MIGHSDCGMLDVHERRAARHGSGPRRRAIDFQPFPDVAARVRTSVEAIRTSPLLPGRRSAPSGFVFDVRSGRLEGV